MDSPTLLPSDRPRARQVSAALARHVWRADEALAAELRNADTSAARPIASQVAAIIVTLLARYAREETVTVAMTVRAIHACTGIALPYEAGELCSISVALVGDLSMSDVTDRLHEGCRTAIPLPVAAMRSVVLDAGAMSGRHAGAELRIGIAPDGSIATLDYDAGLFDASTIARFAGCLERLWTASLRNPAQSLARADLLADDERDMMLRRWNDTAVPRTGTQCMHRLFEAQVGATPGALAAEFGGRSLTYAALNHCANVLATDLVRRGVTADSIVAICMQRSLELMVVLLAIHKAGGALMPIDPDLPRDRVRFKLEDTGCRLMLVPESLVARAAAFADGCRVDVRAITPSVLEHAGAPVGNLPDHCDAAHLAYILYTSGSTGRPKGVLVPHRALCNHALWFADRVGMTTGDRMLQHSSISFDASMAELYAPLVAGATVVLAPAAMHRDLLALPAVVQDERITIVQSVPSALRVSLDSPAMASCHTLRYLISGGEALDAALAAEVFRLLPHVRLGNFYGPTEAAIDATCHDVSRDELTGAALPIGRPVANARCHILDRNMNPVPIGAPGELLIGGLGLAHGYLNMPERTAARFVADPFVPGERLYATGDLARYRVDGCIEYVGRIDTQVKLRGYRIELSEIETALLVHPDVAQAAALLRDANSEAAHLVAWVVADAGAGAALDGAVLRMWLRERLPAWMVPTRIRVIDALPLTSSGKLDRRALESHELDADVEPPAAPDDPLLRSMLAIWQQVLGTRCVGLDDDFFALGGHSLKAIRLLSAIEREHGVSLRAHVLFEAPTIRALAEHLRDRAPVPVSSLIPVRRDGGGIPLFFAPGGGGELLVFEAIARALGAGQPLYVLDMYVFGDAAAAGADFTLADVAARMLDDIRRVQPVGPYQLAGYSLGGNIALEIAQQLRAAGETVHLLALLDCDGPGYPVLQPFVARTLKHVGHALALQPRVGLRYLATRVGKLSRFVRTPHAELELYADQDEAHMVPPEVIEEMEQALTPVLRAWERYVPRFYGGRMLLVRAEVRQAMVGVIDDDPLLGWGPVAGGGVDMLPIACDHFEILHAVNAPPLAALLAPYLLPRERGAS